MKNKKNNFKSEKELQMAILQEKSKGTSDLEIGQKYGVNYKYIEKLITKTQGINISSLKKIKKIKSLQPKCFREAQTSVWSFKQRGNWATHSGIYRGNWSPYIPRNVIIKYSKFGDLVLDYFCGAGTTAIECKLLGRKCIAIDINDKAIELAKMNLDFQIGAEQLSLIEGKKPLKVFEPEVFVGDARNLSFLKDNSVDLICAHPPYANIIHYTDHKEGDLSYYGVDDFLKEMSKVAKESFRVLKEGRQCAILIGDMRKKKHVIPLGFKLINVFLDAGFRLKELVIKRQHNCKTTGFWYENSIKYNFLLLAHEYLPIFEKPDRISHQNIIETTTDNNIFIPNIEKVLIEGKLDEFETTTVWLLPGDNFEECLNRNVIHRYSDGKDYITITFENKNNDNEGDRIISATKLLFIRAPFLMQNVSFTKIEIDNYLNGIKNILEKNWTHLRRDGFVVIQTRDVRIGNYIEPLAKKIVDIIKKDKLWLKEIIIVVENEKCYVEIKDIEKLRIIHHYLLVYEVKK